MNDHSLLALAAELVREAGAAILEIRSRGFQVRQKDDLSPVTAADDKAEAIILQGLRARCPDIPVIAEEETAAGQITAAAETFWLVDPLDGTREFTEGNDEFTVNIGLVRNARPVLGVVGAPALNETFYGIVGHGSWKESAAGRRAIAARSPPREGLTVVASGRHGDTEKLDAFLQGWRVARISNFGSSIKFCRLAEGVADVYPRFGRTMEWDTCAAQAVLESAGGRVTTLDGKPLRYGKPGWENPHFVCWGRAP